jgi:hypothetical protein
MSRRSSRFHVVLAVVAAVIVAVGVYEAAPDNPKTAGSKPEPAAPEGAPQPAKPGPEHAVLAREAGTWEAAVEIRMGPPGAPPQISKGVEVNRICCNGLWLVKEFKSDPAFPPFEGRGLVGYDQAKKKYVAIWVDSDTITPMMTEGTLDAAGKIMTSNGSTVSNGKEMRFREVEVWKDDNTRQFTMYMQGPDGKESAGLSITYTRKE